MSFLTGTRETLQRGGEGWTIPLLTVLGKGSLASRAVSVWEEHASLGTNPDPYSLGGVFKYCFHFIHLFFSKVNYSEVNSPILLNAHFPRTDIKKSHSLPLEVCFPKQHLPSLAGNVGWCWTLQAKFSVGTTPLRSLHQPSEIFAALHWDPWIHPELHWLHSNELAGWGLRYFIALH